MKLVSSTEAYKMSKERQEIQKQQEEVIIDNIELSDTIVSAVMEAIEAGQFECKVYMSFTDARTLYIKKLEKLGYQVKILGHTYRISWGPVSEPPGLFF